MDHTNHIKEKLKAMEGNKRSDAIDRMRSHLKGKLDILDSTALNKNVDQDVLFEKFDEMRFVDWLADKDGRAHEEEVHYLYISSDSRDKTRWPSPAEYNIGIDGELTNIIRCDLIQYSFPKTEPVVNSSNNTLSFSLSPYASVSEITIPTGNYVGATLALELMMKMNSELFSTELLAGTHYLDSEGYVRVLADQSYTASNQFRVVYSASDNKFVFQLLEATGFKVDPAQAWALYIEPKAGALTTTKPSDIFELLGFNRDQVAQDATYDAGSGKYQLFSDTTYVNFGAAASADTRVAFSLSSSQASVLENPTALVIDIEQLNNNDVSQTIASSSSFSTSSCLGVLFSDGDTTRRFEDSSLSLPIQKYYRSGKARINNLNIRLRKSDGSLFNFGYAEHYFTLKFVMKRTQPLKPVFAR